MTGRPSSAVELLLRRQAGVATLRQLVGAGRSAHRVRADVDARRWQRVGSHCVVSHNADLTRLQWMWVAVLDNRGPAALAGMSALEHAGFRFFGRETELIHVVVGRGSTYHRFPGVRVHESRRLHPLDIVSGQGVPHLPYARSALDAAAWQPHPRYACGLVAAVVQQRICTVGELDEAMRYVGRIRHKPHLRVALLDIAGGAEALGELDVADLCRRFDLCPPDRQRVRRDRSGRRRYLDCEWRTDDGRWIVLEVDGSHHAEVGHWEADMRRERDIVVAGRSVLRCSASEARHSQAELAADLAAIGVPADRVVRGVRGSGRAGL